MDNCPSFLRRQESSILLVNHELRFAKFAIASLRHCEGGTTEAICLIEGQIASCLAMTVVLAARHSGLDPESVLVILPKQILSREWGKQRNFNT